MPTNCVIKSVRRERFHNSVASREVYEVVTDDGNTVWVDECHVVRQERLSEGDRALVSYEPADHGYAHFLR